VIDAEQWGRARARLDWKKTGGLMPAIVQDADTGEVLMLGYMNAEALALTETSGRVTFFSRSRQALWTKGETSGHTLELCGLEVDCDGDALLVLARPTGPVCHQGTRTCFGPAPLRPAAAQFGMLARLETVIAERNRERPEGSYTAQLLAGGIRRIAQKVGEEALELALAAVSQEDNEVVAEAADLLYHVMVLLEARQLSLSQVTDELARRHRLSAPP
jgi:phosphoribosyl-ATP pyrophosphohydrolase/phosphoribosyl-AMP cyclohydrolase